ncbi:hypothetical protein ACFQX6_08210 [Streptosporangium lutulentum]
MKDLSPPLEAVLIPVTDTVFAATGSAFGVDALPVVFATLADGTRCCYAAMRAAPKIA